MSTRNNINVSFPEEDTTMYKDIILESSFTDVPVATLSRKYMKLHASFKQKVFYQVR